MAQNGILLLECADYAPNYYELCTHTQLIYALENVFLISIQSLLFEGNAQSAN